MIEHVKHITHGPSSYTLLTSRRSFIGAAAQRATQDLTRHNKSSREESDLARWEGEGGAARPRTQAPKTLPKLTMRFAMSGRPSYDSPHRTSVETMMVTPVERVAAVPFIARQGPAGSNEERSRLQSSWRNAPANPTNKHRGRRTMGRHGNRP